MSPESLALLLLLVPLVSAVLIGAFLRRSGGLAALLSVGASGAIVVFASLLVFGGHRFEVKVPWLTFGDVRIALGFLVNDLTALMLLVVAYVGFVIHVFSLGYMAADPHRGRFFGGLSLFMFAMIGMTLADDLIMLFIFWELVGLASYILINFYFTKPAAVAASKKAFITNRVGDYGFLLGIILAYWAFGTINLNEIAAAIEGTDEGHATATALALLLFCGCIGKSGQIPLHVWLPDAMEGPTPVSALIHAATMVAAGIFLLCRVNVVMTVEALTVILWVGTATAVLAGLWAVAQRDIKKILAYSTISQLGYMVAAFALGSLLYFGQSTKPEVVGPGAAAAMFHLTTHAFFKALLFLGAGSVIHACHHEQDIFRLGGLWRRMPVTFACFTVGFLALIGLPYVTAGFYSKDAILALAYEQNRTVFYLLSFGVLLTAFYMTRLWAVAFFGEARSQGAQHAHENGAVLTGPLVILAVLSVIGGFPWFYDGVLQGAVRGVSDAFPHPHGKVATLVLVVSLAGLAAGAFSFVFYRPGAAADRLEQAAPGVFGFLRARLWFDEAYRFYIARVQQPLAEALLVAEQVVLAWILVRGSAGLAALTGLGVRSLQVGSVRAYAFWFLAGTAVLWAVAYGLF